MTRDELIERMARAYFGTTGTVLCDVDRMFQPRKWEDLDPPDYQCVRGGYRDGCTAALSALCAALPGLSDVIDGKAVIVPVECTGDMLGAGKKAWRKLRLRVSHQPSDDMMTCGVIYRAMIEARPK